MLAPVQEVAKELVARWPAFRVPVNELAEARVLGGDENRFKDMAVLHPGRPVQDLSQLWNEHHDIGGRSMVKDVMNACGTRSVFALKAVGTRFEFGVDEALDVTSGALEGEGHKPEFVIDPLADRDICRRPELMAVRVPRQINGRENSNLCQVHGVFRGARETTKGLYPMLSYGRPSAFGDIPIPSRYQWNENGDYEYQSREDVPWEEKQPTMYWRGEPSGGGRGDRAYGSVS